MTELTDNKEALKRGIRLYKIAKVMNWFVFGINTGWMLLFAVMGEIFLASIHLLLLFAGLWLASSIKRNMYQIMLKLSE